MIPKRICSLDWAWLPNGPKPADHPFGQSLLGAGPATLAKVDPLACFFSPLFAKGSP